MYLQIRLSKLCERMSNASNSTFKWKSLRIIKMEVLTLNVERNGKYNMESKEGMGKYWKTLWKGWKVTGEQGENVPHSLKLSIMWKWKPLYSGKFFPKESIFLPTSLSYPNFLLFLLFSLGPCPNYLVTCSSYSTRNIARYIKTSVKLWFPHFKP